ncbi:hypothetical protein [Zunongwangia endophytica]|uniref:Uncharacterized protein n=1 Tax=Zunongwangia endophytica TaxID=1808945 RepID=A0ABV8H8T0_9FLAO|nr:hypothetical protein [Zunongwangia endophytica]MDN3595332.1 hypothetical protein [Zunongwangia endophytica]
MPGDIKSKEKAIGKRAARIAENYVHSILKSKLNIHNKGDANTVPILEATRITAKMGTHRLLGLNFTSSKVGFMLHYGAAGVREGGNVYLRASRYHKGETLRKPHQVKLPQFQLFDDIYKKSDALDYLIDALGETRTDDVMAKISNLVLQLNTEDK